MSPRKSTNEISPKRKPAKQSLRTTLPQKRVTNTASGDIVIEIEKERSIQWLIEQTRREFQDRPQTPMPKELKPMLASTIKEAFDDKGWQFEIKWDGYRSLAYAYNGKADLRSRNNLSFNIKYPEILKAFENWPVRAVVDGEIVILSEEGKADFSALQNWQLDGTSELLYYAFDLLWVEGIDLRNEPLSFRREVLKKILPEKGRIRYSECIDEYGIDFFEAARQNGLEGIIAKRKDSVYKDGNRTTDWLKIKAEQRHEAVVCGYTKNSDTPRLFSSLVLGIPADGGMKFIGQVGTGFTAKLQREIFKKMNPLFTSQCPFDKVPATGAPTMWVKPNLVCEVKYTELTKDGLMRHPSFQGLRPDKSVSDLNKDDLPVKKQA